MPRHMAGATEAPAFRAVIKIVYPKGMWGGGERYERDIVYGPYATPGAAKAMITRERSQTFRFGYRNPARDLGEVTFEGHVEQSATKWEKVEA